MRPPSCLTHTEPQVSTASIVHLLTVATKRCFPHTQTAKLSEVPGRSLAGPCRLLWVLRELKVAVFTARVTWHKAGLKRAEGDGQEVGSEDLTRTEIVVVQTLSERAGRRRLSEGTRAVV